ncbi:MAG: GIY-YIG nuclease family protein [Alphaproteobacteria bacterium]|nr:GIY-YIG nuclease family protein [Alphaproteobacteria bacterium]
MSARQDPEAFPAEPGAYVLCLGLTRPVRGLAVGPRRHDLMPGCYAYAGSAWGPGGLRARVRRHLRAGKRRHWHIDQLTGRADALAAWGLPGGSECAIVARLSAQGGVTVPLPGFGSSDCTRCRAHLLRLPVTDVADALAFCRGVIGLARGDAPV